MNTNAHRRSFLYTIQGKVKQYAYWLLYLFTNIFKSNTMARKFEPVNGGYIVVLDSQDKKEKMKRWLNAHANIYYSQAPFVRIGIPSVGSFTEPMGADSSYHDSILRVKYNVFATFAGLPLSDKQYVSIMAPVNEVRDILRNLYSFGYKWKKTGTTVEPSKFSNYITEGGTNRVFISLYPDKTMKWDYGTDEKMADGRDWICYTDFRKFMIPLAEFTKQVAADAAAVASAPVCTPQGDAKDAEITRLKGEIVALKSQKSQLRTQLDSVMDQLEGAAFFSDLVEEINDTLEATE